MGTQEEVTHLGFYTLADLLPDPEQQQKEHTRFTIIQRDFCF